LSSFTSQIDEPIAKHLPLNSFEKDAFLLSEKSNLTFTKFNDHTSPFKFVKNTSKISNKKKVYKSRKKMFGMFNKR